MALVGERQMSQIVPLLAALSSTVLHAIVRTIARIPPALWLKLGIIAALIAIKQGALE
ncbi:MAG: hypothetical protein OER95_06395 [Acidimicrobiia bacterium]|nr:hypothetical protein [Acidimicrobiia bacterium]